MKPVALNEVVEKAKTSIIEGVASIMFQSGVAFGVIAGSFKAGEVAGKIMSAALIVKEK